MITNVSFPRSIIKQKYHSVNFNYIRKTVAAGLTLVFKVDTGSILTDLFTKLLDKEKR